MTQTDSFTAGPNGAVPNSRFPVLIHRGALDGGVDGAIARFQQHGWLNNWQNHGIYTYGHFHSTTHECLCCAVGWIDLRLFGAGGQDTRMTAGDVIVMPAGVSHAMRACSDDNIMVGGYPDGRDWDNMRDDAITEVERVAAAKRIMSLPIPATDPVSGSPLQTWITAPSSGDAGLDDFRNGLEPKQT